ncbi:hypothetical protein KSD_30760 [Ktedonobacter sp. SOSP1-85]|uniref:hypothetical protein n=1 Tax=Ktedonobacter sp. SOSP1-85 TaxID=2778367 RepID=UPI0019165CF3|nr:hypothetical protein [Ktedonobacter sp. SOSP1-85]GHO75305.1 hypothetical protein KSD_30760 [Ktedonobacter sp. SOSP1-85]
MNLIFILISLPMAIIMFAVLSLLTRQKNTVRERFTPPIMLASGSFGVFLGTVVSQVMSYGRPAQPDFLLVLIGVLLGFLLAIIAGIAYIRAQRA